MDRVKTMYFGLQIEVWKSTFWNCLHTWTEWKNFYHLDIKKIRGGEAFCVADSLWCNATFCRAEIFSIFAFFQRDKGRKKTWRRLSLSGGIPSELQSHHPPVAFSPWATPWASKTVGLLGRGHFVTHSSLCLFVTSPLFPTLLVVSDSLPLLQGATNTTVPHIYKHRLGQMARATNLPPFCYFLSPSCSHTWYLLRKPREYPCKFFLASVNFYRFNAKNWQFTVYFAVITQKIGNFLCILS